MRDTPDKFKMPASVPVNVWAAFQFWYSTTGETRPNNPVLQGTFQVYLEWYDDWYGEEEEEEYDEDDEE
jgi:hypothetical protein